MDTHRNKDIKALVYLLTYAKLEAVRLNLWDAAHRINQGLVSIIADDADAPETAPDAEGDVCSSAAAQSPVGNT